MSAVILIGGSAGRTDLGVARLVRPAIGPVPSGRMLAAYWFVLNAYPLLLRPGPERP